MFKGFKGCPWAPPKVANRFYKRGFGLWQPHQLLWIPPHPALTRVIQGLLERMRRAAYLRKIIASREQFRLAFVLPRVGLTP